MGLKVDTAPRQNPAPAGSNLTYGMLEEVGRTIVTGGYEGRSFPTEAELAKEHSVSRSVTREAVKMLTAKGLLTARPRKGTSVQPPSSWNLFDPDVLRWLMERKFSLNLLRQFSELRVAIEPMAAALAAAAADSDEIEAIAAGYRRMEAAEAGGDDPLEADIAFHVAILNASANPFYIQFRDVVATALRTSIQFTNRFKGRTADLASHRAVLSAIEVRDSDGARATMATIIGEVMLLIGEAERSGKAA
ncbi:FadR/GntR family transcriptional regulator [Allosphingosinicella sp.]|jgi:DNA-binding FadR family transcriptional regulator|uniref:FadR/GntR family transcriptional regulator n=1 Tax=Allosphingosinicella sp. TaxID=2823234 RepID=UPI002EE88D5F